MGLDFGKSMKPQVIEVKVENGVTVHRYKARAARGSSALRRWAAQRTFGVLGMEGKPTGFTSGHDWNPPHHRDPYLWPNGKPA
jgi:hypothetical protein